MSSTILNMSLRSARLIRRSIPRSTTFTPIRMASSKLDSNTISNITDKEATLTGSDQPTKHGPTAQAQKHAGAEITSQVVSDITQAERAITGSDGPVKGGPAAYAQSGLAQNVTSTNSNSSSNTNTQSSSTTNIQSNSNNTGTASGNLDSATISKITAAEKEITGNDQPVPGGPTAQAQKHVGEPITSESLHDITEGEKKITGGERVKGGPTSTAQSELGKSRN